MTEEIWKDITGYEGKYMVSNLGNVKSFWKGKLGKLLSKRKNRHGYFQVYLYSDSKTRKMFTIHRLVAETFIHNPDNLPVINHIDECKTNNCVENLEWCSVKYNTCYGNSISKSLQTRKIRNRKTAPKQVLQFTKNGDFIKEYTSLSEAALQTKISVSNICKCCKGLSSYASGYIWKYKKND